MPGFSINEGLPRDWSFLVVVKVELEVGAVQVMLMNNRE